MTESNPTQVILTDDGIKIIKAQNTADNATSGVTNLNDPNLMSVIEKQTQASQYAGLTSQYNVILKRAKDASINTIDLTTAYTNLNTFMAAILTDTTKASDVDRKTYKSLIDAYNTALSNVQTALSNNFNTDISNMRSNVSTASEAASSAAIVASQAAATGNSANQVASQAASAANKASADYTALSSGVKDGSVVHITTKTVIDDAVIGTAEIVNAAITDAKIGNVSADKITAGTIDFNTITGKNINASNITTGKMSAERLDVGKLSTVSADLGDVTTGSLKGVDIVANMFSTPNGSFTTDSNGAVVASNLTIRGVTNLVYNAALLGANGSYIPGWSIGNNGICWSNVMHDGVPSIGFNASTGAGVWANFAQTKLHPLNGATGQPYSASVWFKEDGSDTSLLWNLTLAFFDSNGNRIEGANGWNNWKGISSEQNWRYVTINNAVAPSNAVYVGLQYFAYNGHGNACFSSPMLTQTAQSTGYQPDTGNVISAGEIDGSVINGSTINGTTINTPNLNLGLNGTFTEDFDYTQDSSKFLPKKNKGTLTFNHGVLQSKGNMQTYVNGQWGGMNDNFSFQAGLDNSQWTEVAPGYIKFDLFKQNDIDVGERTYIDPTGYYYTSRNGMTSYLGNILQTSQVQTPSVIGKYIGPSAGQNLLQIVNNGNDYGLQVGSYGGGEGVLSDFIYNTTSSGSSNVHITENGRLVRSTSASKYKYNIKNPDIETTLGDRLLNVHMATWNDKRAVDMYAEQLSTGEEREKSSIDKYYGLIAEQLRDAGLDMFISYGKNHEIEGIQYDRAWVPLLSVIRRLNDKVNEYELRLSKLEGASK